VGWDMIRGKRRDGEDGRTDAISPPLLCTAPSSFTSLFMQLSYCMREGVESRALFNNTSIPLFLTVHEREPSLATYPATAHPLHFLLLLPSTYCKQ
jgi:hypothetical protein